MLGLIVLFAFFVYLLIAILVVLGVARLAREQGRSPRRWGWAAAIVMYLLVFWDHLPTLLLHKYYCATKAGFWIYKTPEQWKAENPEVAETLTYAEELPRMIEDADGVTHQWLNERFKREMRDRKTSLLPLTVSESIIRDVVRNETVVKIVGVYSGYGALGVGGPKAWKAWVGSEPCTPYAAFRSVFDQFRKLGRKVK